MPNLPFKLLVCDQTGRTWIGHLFFGLLGIVVGVLLLAYATAGAIYEYKDSFQKGQNLPSIDAIVCLAGARGRIPAASEIWLAYYQDAARAPGTKNKSRLPILYISGMGSRANWDVLLRQVMREVRPFIKPEHVIMETVSSNTVENAQVFVDQARQNKWRRILLLTSSYHMRRARHIFHKTLEEKPGVSIQVETFSLINSPFTSKEWARSIEGVRLTVMEYLKWVYYRLFWDYGFARKSPFAKT